MIKSTVLESEFDVTAAMHVALHHGPYIVPAFDFVKDYVAVQQNILLVG